MQGKPCTMRVNLWLEIDRGIIFGLGRAQLLAKVAQYGSLKKAAEDLGMSYRAAWGKIKKTEKIIGAPLLDRSGARRDGYVLTELGQELLNSYTQWFKYVEKIALQKAQELFPWHIESLDNREHFPITCR